jgi:hypothetical protein
MALPAQREGRNDLTAGWWPLPETEPTGGAATRRGGNNRVDLAR